MDSGGPAWDEWCKPEAALLVAFFHFGENLKWSWDVENAMLFTALQP
jgi:hypothetical protein